MSSRNAPAPPGGISPSAWRWCPLTRVRPERWTDTALTPRVRRLIDARGCAREEAWFAGAGSQLPPSAMRWQGGATSERSVPAAPRGGGLEPLLNAAMSGRALEEHEIVRLFAAEGRELEAVLRCGR